MLSTMMNFYKCVKQLVNLALVFSHLLKTTLGEGGRSSPVLSAPVLRGVGACCENLGRERATPRSSPRSELGCAVAESCRRRRGLAVVVVARRAWFSERGEEGMTLRTSCGGGGRGVAPFYRVREVGRWPAG
jgi:hypothetical protein